MRLLVACCCALTLACGGETRHPVQPAQLSRDGTYTLRTVDGFGLPFALPGGSVLNAESLTLTADSTFAARTDQQITDVTGVHLSTVNNEGTYSIAGLFLTLRYSNGTALVLFFSGPDEVTGHCCGRTWVYRR